MSQKEKRKKQNRSRKSSTQQDEKLTNQFVSAINVLVYILLVLFDFFYIYHMNSPSSEARWCLLSTAAALLPLLGFALVAITKKEIIITISFFHLVIFMIFIWMLLSALWALDRVTLISELINYSSWMVLIFFFIFYGAKLNITLISRIFSISVTAVSLVGIFQFFGIDGNVFPQFVSPASTFVNKNLATPMTVLILPIIYYQLLTDESKLWVRINAVCFTLTLTYLLAAATRSSWLGGLFSLLVTIIVLVINRDIRKIFSARILKKQFLYMLLICIILAFSTVALHEKGGYSGTETVLPKLKSIISDEITKGTGDIRLTIWMNSLSMIYDHPLHGLGLGSFGAAYPYYHNDIVKDNHYSGIIFMGGAHNDLLQFLTELGIIGFILIVLMFAYMFYMLFKLIKQDKGEMLPYYLGFATGISGLLIDSLFNFPLHKATYLFYLAVMAGLIHNYFVSNFKGQVRTVSYNINSKFLSIPAVIFFSVLLIAAVMSSHRRYFGSVSYNNSKYYALRNKLDEAIYFGQAAVKDWPYSNQPLFLTAGLMYTRYTNNKSKENYYAATKYNNMALRGMPYWYYLLDIKLKLALETNNPEYIRKFQKYIPAFLKTVPNDKILEGYQMAGDIFLRSNNLLEAQKYYQQAKNIKGPNHR